MFERSRSYDYFSVGGASCANGFDLEYSTVLGHHRTLQFRLPGSDEVQSRRFDWFTATILSALFVLAMRAPLYWPKVFLLCLLWKSVNSLLERSYKGWHWVEHQAALWLEGDPEERFEDINPTSTRCGSTFVVAQALLLTSIVMVGDHGLWALPVLLSASATWTAFRKQSKIPLLRRWLRWGLIGCAWPTTFICLIAQRVLYMRRPNAEQLRWAKQWAMETAPLIADSLVTDGTPRIVKIVPPRKM